MIDDFETSGERRPPAATIVLSALLLGAAAVVTYLWWRRHPREDDGGTGSPPPEALCPVDVVRESRLTLDANGNVHGHERTIPIRIPPGDSRRHGIKWIVNNRHGKASREVHMANMRLGSKAGARRELFEAGSDKQVIDGGAEQAFYSCILADAPEAEYFYDIVVDGDLKIDPQIAIIRR